MKRSSWLEPNNSGNFAKIYLGKGPYLMSGKPEIGLNVQLPCGVADALGFDAHAIEQ